MGLRKVSSWRIQQVGWFWKRWKFYFTTRGYFEMSNKTYQLMPDDLAKSGAVPVGSYDGRRLWWTEAGVFWVDSDLCGEDVLLLALDRQRREDAKLDRLRREAGITPRQG